VAPPGTRSELQRSLAFSHAFGSLHSCLVGILEVARRACTADNGDRPELQVRGCIIDFV